MKSTKPAKRKVYDKIAILESRFNHDPQKVANAASQDLNKANQRLTASGVIGPLILSILFSIFPISLHPLLIRNMSSIFEYEAIIASVQKNYVEIEMMQQSLPFRSKAKTKKSKKIQRHRIQMRKNGR